MGVAPDKVRAVTEDDIEPEGAPPDERAVRRSKPARESHASALSGGEQS